MRSRLAAVVRGRRGLKHVHLRSHAPASCWCSNTTDPRSGEGAARWALVNCAGTGLAATGFRPPTVVQDMRDAGHPCGYGTSVLVADDWASRHRRMRWAAVHGIVRAVALTAGTSERPSDALPFGRTSTWARRSRGAPHKPALYTDCESAPPDTALNPHELESSFLRLWTCRRIRNQTTPRGLRSTQKGTTFQVGTSLGRVAGTAQTRPLTTAGHRGGG